MGMGIGLPTPWSILLEYADDVDDADDAVDADDANVDLMNTKDDDKGCDGNADDSNNGD